MELIIIGFILLIIGICVYMSKSSCCKDEHSDDDDIRIILPGGEEIIMVNQRKKDKSKPIKILLDGMYFDCNGAGHTVRRKYKV